MSDFVVTWYIEPDDQHQDSAWYTGSSTTVLATIQHGGRIADIFVCGEMRLHLPDRKEDGSFDFDSDPKVICDCHELSRYVTTDEELYGLADLCDENGWELWHNNSWFEVRELIDGCYVDCWDDPEHELNSAVEAAKEMLSLPQEAGVA